MFSQDRCRNGEKCGWRAEMEEEINRINQVIPTTPVNEKTEEMEGRKEPYGNHSLCLSSQGCRSFERDIKSQH